MPANPIIVSCPANTWTKVATAVKFGQVHKFKPIDAYLLHTYRLTGDPAPSDLVDAVDFGKCQSLPINAATLIDVYLYPRNDAADVRVDI